MRTRATVLQAVGEPLSLAEVELAARGVPARTAWTTALATPRPGRPANPYSFAPPSADGAAG